MTELANLRIRGVMLLAILGWGSTVALLFLSLLFNLNNEWLVVGLSAAINMIPTWLATRDRYDAPVGIAIGVMAAVQPAILVYLLDGHLWQMEGHFYFFVGLAALTLLCDWRPIAVAAGLIAIHHLLLSYVAPEWVFIGSGDLTRVMVHALAVVMTLGLLGPLMVHMGKLFVEQAEARAASEESAASAHAALETARQAQAEVGIEREKRLEAERNANADARRSELLALATAFEGSVANIAQSVATAADQMADAASNMHHFAHVAGEQSTGAARDAERASHNALKVSAGVSELSKSILNIAANAAQQAELGEAARGASKTGEEVIRTLSERTTNIEAFVGLIRGVASQTNLLALNATIESARAGEAGRGFGVVAAEVKALAAKAQAATGQINQLVSDIDSGAGEAESVIAKISRAMGDLAEAAEKMRGVIGDQTSVASLIEQSAVDSAAGADQIARRIGEVAKAAGEAVKLSDEVHASADGLTRIAHGLRSATDEFLSQLRAA